MRLVMPPPPHPSHYRSHLSNFNHAYLKRYLDRSHALSVPARGTEPPVTSRRNERRYAERITRRHMLPRCFTHLTNAQILEPHTPIRPRHLLESFSKPSPQIRAGHTHLRLARSSDTPASCLLRVFCPCCRIHQDNRINPQPLAHSCYHLPRT